MKHPKEIGKAVSVDASAYEAVKAGRTTVIYRTCDEWNRRKFLSQPIRWLFVCRTNETTGECLKFDIREILTTTPPSDFSSIPVIAIRLGDLVEIRNQKTGERTFRFAPKRSAP